MEEKKLSTIIQEFENHSYEHKRKAFFEALNKFSEDKYGDKLITGNLGIDNNSQVNEQVMYAYINDISNQTCDEKDNNKYNAIKKRFERMITSRHIYKQSANSATESISREFIIEIAFVLSSPKNNGAENNIGMNGREICNKLLGALGYYRLPAPSVLEMFYAYALENSISFKEIHQKYDNYQTKKNKIEIEKVSPNSSANGDNTTHFVDLALKANNENLFSIMREIELGLEQHSKATSDFFKKTWRKQVETLSTCNLANPDREPAEDEEKIDFKAKVEFYTTFCQKCPRFFKNYEDYKIYKNKHCWKRSNNEILSSKGGFEFSIIKGNIEESVDEDENRIVNTFYKLETLSGNIQDVMNGKKNITREGFLMLLLFGCENYDSEKLSQIIAPRYTSLNPEVYFDNFIIMVSSFRMDGETIIYKDFKSKVEYKVTGYNGSIYMDTPHIFRKSIIFEFAKKYSSEMAINFIDKNFSVNPTIN